MSNMWLKFWIYHEKNKHHNVRHGKDAGKQDILIFPQCVRHLQDCHNLGLIHKGLEISINGKVKIQT